MSADAAHRLSPDLRAAISAFLNDSRGDQAFDVSEALDAVRRVFPNLEISDGELVDAIASEASTAGFHIHYDADQNPKALERRALDRWDDEGGATGRPLRGE
ncbi:MAG TPA: hypothetical protein VFT61_04560 [Sphingomicrobium sp.]|jgi:hypothetical protein|nr:hypothetical protein [Sphingomicrobium sp.]